MVSIINDSFIEDDKRVTSNLFLSSLNSWYPEGLKCKVNKLSRPFNGRYNETLILPCILEVLEKMEWCRTRELDEEGNIKYVENPVTANEEVSIVVSDDIKFVTFYLKLKVEMGLDTDPELIVHNQSSAYDLINSAYMSNGILPIGNHKSFITNTDELYEYLTDYTFKAFADKGNFNGKKYFKLKTDDVTEPNPFRRTIPNFAD
jgi:hypothetical protein